MWLTFQLFDDDDSVDLITVYAKAVLYGDHNLELPALLSSESMVVLHKSFKSKSNHLLQAEVSLPLHARYPVSNSILILLNNMCLLWCNTCKILLGGFLLRRDSRILSSFHSRGFLNLHFLGSTLLRNQYSKHRLNIKSQFYQQICFVFGADVTMCVHKNVNEHTYTCTSRGLKHDNLFLCFFLSINICPVYLTTRLMCCSHSAWKVM